MPITYKATLKSTEGKEVTIEIEEPDPAGATGEGAEPEQNSSEGSFSFTDNNGKRLTITIAE